MAKHRLMIVKGLSPHEHEIQYCLTHGVQKVHPPASSLIYAHCKACPPQHLRRQWPRIPLRTKAPEHQSVPVTAEKLKEFCLSIFSVELDFLYASWSEIYAAVFGLL